MEFPSISQSQSRGESAYRLAILDDYQDVAAGYFSKLEPSIEVSRFSATLDVRRDDEKAQLIERLKPFHVISTMRERTSLPSDVIMQLPNLKLILTTGIFNASIAIETCEKQGILVVGTSGKRLVERSAPPDAPSLSYQSTAQHTWALILALVRLVPQNHLSIIHGGWQTGFATSLTNQVLGILGLGRLGLLVAQIAIRAFGMKVIAWSTTLTDEVVQQRAKELSLPPGNLKKAQDKEDFFRSADIVSVHYVLSERSVGIVGERELSQMKPRAFLVNTSRGALIDESALLNVLKRGAIQGAALDVYDREPLPSDSEWRTTEWGQHGSSHVVLSPHMGYVEKQTIYSWYEESMHSLDMWLRGETPPILL